VIGDSGAVRVYVDGAKVLDLAGVDTQQQANAQAGSSSSATRTVRSPICSTIST
jgi:hypothetical protein